MTNQVAKQENADIIEQVVANGNLANLTTEQRTNYYMRICKSLGLNPLTRPFEYITLNGKLTLYARKDATDQLRALKGISISKLDISYQDEWIVVTVAAHDAAGREDSEVGVVSKKDMRGDFGNAVMKAVTKAKRRVTLSICGLGMLDETEVETIPDAVHLPVEIAPAASLAENKPEVATEVAPMCPLHDVAMMRTEKAGKLSRWFHRRADGVVCTGEAKPEPAMAGK